MPPSRFVLYGAVLSVLAAYAFYLRYQHGRTLIRVWETSNASTVAGRVALSLLGWYRRPVDSWAICENGIYLPKRYQNTFLPWEALARADWQGERLILDTGGPMFSPERGLYELEVPSAQCSEVASALSRCFSQAAS